MKLSELIPKLNSELSAVEISGVTSDSRQVKEGYAFFCINGPILDGHGYANDALKKGAAIIVAEKDLKITNQIIVKDTREAFFKACSNWFGNPLKSMKLIGVTGTNGKTSVSYMTKEILEKAGHKCGLIGTIQHMIGDETLPSNNTTPGAYELNEMFYNMKNAGCDYVIMEVSSHALDQKRICGVTFDVAMFTNLTQDHLDYHKTMDNYLRAKQKLFKMCKTAIVNYDDMYTPKLLEGVKAEIVTYSAESNNATYSAKGIGYKADGVDFDIVGYNLIARINMKTGGKFSVYNALCAACCGVVLGLPVREVAASLSKLNGVKGRAEVVPTGRDFHVIIDYAHTPDGLENILSTFSDVPKNRLITLFGCGGDRDKTKRSIMGSVAAKLSDLCIVTSDNPRTENPSQIIKDIVVGFKDSKTPYVVIENRIEAIKYAINNASEGDIIVLAGKGHETYQILNTGKIHLDEREIVKEALEELE